MTVAEIIYQVILASISLFIFYILIGIIFTVIGFRILTAKWISVGITSAFLFSVLLIAVFIHRISGEIMYWLLLLSVNCATMPFLYWVDKRRAGKEEETRIPESALHFFAFLGGGVGALISQRLFNHKTTKHSFRVVFWISFGVSVFIYLLSFYLSIFGIDGLHKILNYQIGFG